MRWLLMCLMLIGLCLFVAPDAMGLEADSPPTGVERLMVPVTADVVDRGGNPTPALKPFERTRKRGLSLRELRAMGVTFRNVKRCMAEMQAAGELEGLADTEIGLEVILKLQGENAKAFEDVDWDAVFAWIMKLIEAIMRIVGGFGDNWTIPLTLAA